MGCIHFSTPHSSPTCEMQQEMESVVEEKIYSWSNRKRISSDEYLIEDLSDERVFRPPKTSTSSCDGVPMTISKCSNCVIGCFNHHSTITVTNCFKCTFFLGPTSGSVNVHDCSDCDMICAAMQIRTRDCHNILISLLCATQPSIESSSSLQLCPFFFSYPDLEVQLQRAELSIFNNNWYHVFDFNASESEETNWTLVRGKDFRSVMEERFKCLTSFSGFENSLDGKSCHLFHVPIIEGYIRSSQHDSCLVLFFLPSKGRMEESRTEGEKSEGEKSKGEKSEGEESERAEDERTGGWEKDGSAWGKVLQFTNQIQRREETYLIKTIQIARKDLDETNLIRVIKKHNKWKELVVLHVASSSNTIRNEICSTLQALSTCSKIPDFVHITESPETTRQLHEVIFSK